MDYLDPAKKRAHTIRLFIGYGLMAVAIAAASLILFMLSYGYDINRHTGEVIQNGLVYVGSHPVAANVYLNGANKGKTDLKLVIPAGSYNFELKASGYRTWKNTVKLDGGDIEQLIYPFLFPSKLTTTDQQLYADIPQLATQSLDKHWLLVQPTGPLTHFDMFDVSSKTGPQTVVDLPANILTATTGAQSLTAVEWSSDNKHVLLKHTYAEGTEFIVLDRTAPADSVNLNKTFSVNPSTINLRDKHFDRYYIYDASTQVLSTSDLKDKQVKTLLNKVIVFKSFGANQVLYVTNDNADKSKYSVKLWDGNRSYLLHAYPASGDYKLDMASFDGADYVVIASSTNGAAYLYKDPLSQAKSGHTPAPFLLLRIDQPQYVSFSANTRFIAVQAGNRFAIYDIDQNQRFYYQLADSFAPDTKAVWMDGHRLTAAVNNVTEVFDFDGTNLQKLSPALAGFNPFFDPGYSALYNIGPSAAVPKRSALTRALLKIQ